ncbi:hypothetical protein CYLTODRAFT_420319 [Cylindrobasidium torrendii FP15055 ss-10]|uniref:EthD domain-containing protein n=1 Tax=Cylindrobasidium torrendii FP15055 ss-10 TaxID=1314674 RepID=A0A0D7BH32_9AGAR|nr:hypothetical protein CYLTODRAFT_420319 [Cylindrobasidium torrendii FP15055 ss-10]
MPDSSTLPTDTTWPVPPKSSRARLLLFVRRKPGLSKEEFREYYYKHHVPSMLAIMPEPKYLKFHLMEINDEINALLESRGAETLKGYDNVMLVEAASWEDLFKIRNDEAFYKARMEDEARFIDVPSVPLPLISIPFLDD